MKAVNAATAMLIDLLRKKSEENSGPEFNEGHPYFTALKAAKLIGVDVTSEKFRKATANSLELWSMITIASMIGDVINEIAKTGQAAMAAGGEAKKEAEELLTSMQFITDVFQSWANMLDAEHIAEFVLEDGEKRYAAALAAGHPSANFSEKKMTAEEAIEDLKSKLQETLNKKAEQEAAAKKSKPPVTPQDIMQMLCESRTKPSVN
jgi:ArsR family metal-binding transcriptional regulator